ncbi:hypothetical protein PILCRDRAFT_820342 [Piloderma croceum F 1598]|uniref:Uncharacterized protein n=1 Tax=Piloderma croceum (strain F 1598) TaxID=765440 RepID=A0A0C3BYL3_PILCF|nr:hypothetical protein PILCRDRAFT_820342 [Piloderma croceum F 1598]
MFGGPRKLVVNVERGSEKSTSETFCKNDRQVAFQAGSSEMKVSRVTWRSSGRVGSAKIIPVQD